MATITRRESKAGTISYLVQVRVKEQPPAAKTFSAREHGSAKAAQRAAQAWAVETERAVRTGRFTDARRRTLGELIEVYERDIVPTLRRRKAAHKKLAQLRWWESRLGSHRPLDEIDGPLLLRVKKELMSTRSGPTFNRYLAALSSAMKAAVQTLHWMRENPCRWVERAPDGFRRTRFFDPDQDELPRLLAACKARSPELYEIVVVALCTGGRRAKVEGLDWDHVNLSWETLGKPDDEGSATFPDTKNGEDVTVPLFGEALDLLRQRYRRRRIDTRLVWPRRDGLKPIRTRTDWDEARKAAGLPFGREQGLDAVVFHTLRHATGSRLAMSGATVPEIQAHLGQRTALAAENYIHLARSHKSTVARRMHEKFLKAELGAG